MTKVTTMRKIITVPEMIEAIKEHYNLNDTLLAVNLKVTNQTVKAWKEGKKPRKDSYLALTELYEGICEEIHRETAEVTEVTEKKPYEISYPKHNKIVFYIDDYLGGFKERTFDITDSCDKRLYDMGLYFDTLEEAEQFKREQTLIKKIKCWAKEQQGDWVPNWNDGNETKYHISFKNNRLSIWHWYTNNLSTKLPRFKSQEIAQACIDEFGEEIIEVFC